MYSDEDILKVIILLMQGEGDDEQLSFWLDHELKDLEIVLNLIFHSKEKLTPQQVFERAKVLSKPILL